MEYPYQPADRATVLRYLGAAGWTPDASTAALLDRAESCLAEAASPRGVWRVLPDGALDLTNSGEDLARHLHGCGGVVLMAATLEHGEAVKNGQTGETVGWRLRIPDIDAGRMAEQYLLHARKDLENGGYVVSVVPRGQV